MQRRRRIVRRSPAEADTKGETMRLRHLLMPIVLAAATITVVPEVASAAPTKVGIESFTLTSDIATEGGVVTASGVINDTGQDIVVSDFQDTFDFGVHGKVTIFHSPIRRNEHFSQKKCAFRVTEQGTYVFGNGTGEWANYTGSGTYTVKAEAVNACGENPVGTVTITAKGPIT